MLIGDSAYPPATYPTEVAGQPVVGWCVYIGGDTPHVWTDAEIAALKAQAHVSYILPIFVRSNPQSAVAVTDAVAAVDWAKAHGQAAGTLIMWDYETAVDSGYETAVDQYLQAQAGLHEVLYGSKSTVVQNARPSGGYDEASWTGTDYAPTDTADQFGSWSTYDMNDFKTTAPVWNFRAVPAPAQEDDVSGTIRSQLLHPDEYAWTTPSGRTHFNMQCDGYGETASLRLVTWVGNNPDVHEHLAVGGAQHFVSVQLPAGCTGVTVRREDTFDFPVGVAFA